MSGKRNENFPPNAFKENQRFHKQPAQQRESKESTNQLTGTKIFSRSYDQSSLPQQLNGNPSTNNISGVAGNEFIIKRNESSRGRERKPSYSLTKNPTDAHYNKKKNTNDVDMNMNSNYTNGGHYVTPNKNYMQFNANSNNTKVTNLSAGNISLGANNNDKYFL